MKFRLEISTTNLLLAFNVGMFCLTSLLTVLFASSSDALDFLGADVYQFIIHGEIWRLITSTFLHANIFHLLINMYALYVLGIFYENQFSGRSLFNLYVMAGLGGSLLSTLVSLIAVILGLKDPDVYVLGVGASGALFGILGFFVISKNVFLDKQRLYSILLLNLFIGILFAGVIDNWAHLGGFSTGLLLGFIDNKMSFSAQARISKFLFSISILLVILSYAGLIIYNIFQIFSS